MKHRRFPISRRTLLRGSGVALGLPWLEAMTAAPAPHHDRAKPLHRSAWPCSTCRTACTPTCGLRKARGAISSCRQRSSR